MSDSVTQLDLIQQSQAQKEVTANALFESASSSMLFARRASTSLGLTWGFYGGTFKVTATTRTRLADGTVALVASSTNYIEADASTGAVTRNGTAFTVGRIPLYKAITGSAGVNSWEDWRAVPLAAV